jgi:hypothetical protein
MVARSFLSERWFVLLAGLMAICVGMTVHDDRASSGSEQVLAYGSMALVSAWLLAKGWSWWHAGHRHSAATRRGGHDA